MSLLVTLLVTEEMEEDECTTCSVQFLMYGWPLTIKFVNKFSEDEVVGRGVVDVVDSEVTSRSADNSLSFDGLYG